jgi:diguanylate cyclase (GGDEF)-like protein/PAS domain S-box-containing protein
METERESTSGHAPSTGNGRGDPARQGAVVPGPNGAPGRMLPDLETVAESVPIGIFQTELATGMAYCNRRLLEITGLAADEALGSRWLRVVHPDDRDMVERSFKAAWRERRELASEMRIVTAEGAVRWIRVRTSPSRDAEGEVSGFIGSVEDVTDRVHAEDTAARLTATCELTTDFVGIGGADGRLMYLNRSGREALGIGLDEDVTQIDALGLYAPWTHELLKGEVYQSVSRDGSWSGELALVARDGREIPISTVTMAHRDLDGGIDCYSTVSRDITREKSIERELAKVAARSSSVMAHATDLVTVQDAEGTLREVSESVKELLGYEPSELIGRAGIELMHPDDVEATVEAAAAALQAPGRAVQVQCRVRHRDGSWKWLASRITNLLEEPAVAGIVAVCWDETERRQIERALRESESRFRSLAASSPLGIVYADASGRPTYANKRWLEICGLALEDVLTGPKWHAAHPGDRERLQTASLDALDHGREFAGQYRIVRPDGAVRHVRARVAPVRNEHGAITGYVGSIEDITEEAEARSHTDRLAALLESTPDYAGITDSGGRILYLNAGARKLFGIDPDADVSTLTSQDVAAFTDWAEQKIESELMPGVDRDGVWTGELAFVVPDGREVPVSVVSVAHRGPDGEIAFYSTIARDISGLKAIEAQLAKSEAWSRSLVQHAMDLVTVSDDQGRLLYVSPSSRDNLGYEPDEIDAADLEKMLHPDDLPILVRAVEHAMASPGQSFPAEYRVRHRDGSWRVLESMITNLFEDPTVRGLVTNSRDVTERRAAEMARARSEAAMRAVVQSSPLAIFAVGPDGHTRLWSEACEEIFGVRAEDAIGRPPPVLPADRSDLEGLWERVLVGETIRSVELSYPRSGDGPIELSLSAAPVRESDGRVVAAMGVVADITDRKKAEQALRQSEERFRSLAQHSSDIVLLWDARGVITYASPSVLAYTGYEVGQTAGKTAPDVVHPDDRSVVGAAFKKVLRKGGSTRPFEARVRRQDGEYRRLEMIVTNLLDEPSVRGVVLNAHDITERAEATEALRQSNATMSAIVENSPLAIYSLDANGVITHWNRACEQLFGWTADEAIGQFSLTVPEHDTELHAELRAQVMSDQVITEVELRRATKHRGLIDVSFSAAPLRDEEGQITGILALAADISDRKAAEEALRASEERFRALVQHSSDIIAVLNRDGTTRYTSPSAERIMGYPESLIAGADVLSFIHPDDVEPVREIFNRALEREAITGPVEFRMRHADGSWRYLEAIANNLLDNPAVEGLVITAREVSERKESEEALLRSRERFRALVQNLSDVITVVDSEFRITYTSPAAERLFGFEDHDDAWVNPIGQVHPDDAERMATLLGDQLREHGITEPVPFRIRHRDGTWRNVEAIANDLLDDPAVQGVVVTTRDVHERTRAEAMVADQARILEMVAQGAPLPETLSAMCRVVEAQEPGVRCSVLLVDEDENRLRHGATPSLPEGFVRALAEGVPIAENSASCGTAAHRGQPVVVTDIESDPLWTGYAEVALAHGLNACWSTPILAASDDRVLGTFDVYYPERRDPAAEHVQVVEMVVHLAAMAIERKAFEDRLAHQAHHDPLTGLPNRVLFLEFLVLALARARRHRSSVAVLFLDLDRFKVVNDSLGHDAGDDLLVAMARRLKGVVRPGDTIARFGGDEFTVLCEDLSGPHARQQAIDLAERLLEAIHSPFELDGDETFLSASIGIALAGGASDRPEALLRDADAAMYRAKDRGKGRWELFDEEMRSTARQRLETENALHRALDRHEFRVFYQPVVSLSEGRCVGAEALVRWQHPDRGLVAPYEFITLAEETGLIVPLGAWVLEEACRQVAEWQKDLRADSSFVVSVNLSARQLAQPDLVTSVASALERSGADARNLCLEITESVLMDDAEGTIGSITALKSLGVKLSIDDFGTGYSSLGYLKRFPVDSVKVDQSFVDGLGSDPEDSAIVAAVVSLGHALGLTVVAEGVESAEQLEELIALGCDQAQGFFFAPPQPASDVGAMVGHGRRWRPPGASLMGTARRFVNDRRGRRSAS